MVTTDHSDVSAAPLSFGWLGKFVYLPLFLLPFILSVVA